VAETQRFRENNTDESHTVSNLKFQAVLGLMSSKPPPYTALIGVIYVKIA
jgi:hypothetical protein